MRKYYIKTHSEGLRSGHSSGAKLVNTVKLLVYKVLEGLGVDCESHFFERDGQNLYIAILDANIEGALKEYTHFNSKDLAVQELLCGALIQLPTDVHLSDTQHQQAEALVASDTVAQTLYVKQQNLICWRD